MAAAIAGAGPIAQIQAQPQSYAKRAPVEAYMMDRAAEIALARSAAPPAISKDATVLVLTRTGYEMAAQYAGPV